MSEAFVNTLRRDYLAGEDRSTAAAVLDQIPSWIRDYNGIAPHSALNYRAPTEYRRMKLEELEDELLQGQQDSQMTNVAGPKERTVRS
jgi:transposase InsO family protein